MFGVVNALRDKYVLLCTRSPNGEFENHGYFSVAWPRCREHARRCPLVMADRKERLSFAPRKIDTIGTQREQTSFKLLEYRYPLLTVPSATAFEPEPEQRIERTHVHRSPNK